jgi:hypothetical protein
MKKLYGVANVVNPMSLKYKTTDAVGTPSDVFLAYCHKVVERKFKDPKFAGVLLVDQNDSAENESLLFQTRNLAVPIFFDNPAENVHKVYNEIHLFVLEVASYFARPDDSLKDNVSEICEYFTNWGFSNDNTWVGIDEYSDLFDTFMNQAQSKPESLANIKLADTSTWTGTQHLMHEVMSSLGRTIAYRFFELIAIRDPRTGEIKYTHNNVVHFGIPAKK